MVDKNIEDFGIAIEVDVDSSQIERVKKEIKELEKSAQSIKSKVGIDSSKISTTSTIGSTGAALQNDQLERIAQLLESIDKSSKKGSKDKGFFDSEGKKDNSKLVNLIDGLFNKFPSTLSSGQQLGGFLGATVGSLGGPIGSAVGGIVGQAVSKSASFISDKYESILDENFHFRQISEQTGKTAEELYKLKTQAALVGGSFEQLVASNQSLADEFVSGLSTDKAQLLLAAGIDISRLYQKTGGNLDKINQEIFSKLDESLSGVNPLIKSAQLRKFGFSTEEQTVRRHIGDEGVEQRAEKTLQFATQGGQNPILRKDFQSQVNEFFGAKADLEASIRNLFSQPNFITKAISGVVDFKAQTVNLFANVVNGATQDLNAKSSAESTNKVLTDYYTKSKSLVPNHVNTDSSSKSLDDYAARLNQSNFFGSNPNSSLSNYYSNSFPDMASGKVSVPR